MSDPLSHELEGKGSLRKCIHCGRWFHNESDWGEEEKPCPERLAALLLRHGGHTDHCTSHTKGECDCGWEDIKGELRRVAV